MQHMTSPRPAEIEPSRAGMSGDSPLSVLKYLENASSDTKKEYLLAAQRQLTDKISDLKGRLDTAEYQLKECRDCLARINGR